MLELKNISLKRGNKTILKNIDASAESGEITALLGVNGSGKTSLLSCIAGILENESGNIDINVRTEETNPDERHRMISYVFDDGGTIPLLTIEEQLILQCLVNDISREHALERTAHIIELFNLKKHREYRADELSAGLRKKLGLGLGIIREAEVFLFDEPFSSLDIQSGAIVLEVLKTLKKQGKTVILTTHLPSYVSDILDCVWHLDDGRITTRRDVDNFNMNFGAGNEYSSGIDSPDLPWMEKSE